MHANSMLLLHQTRNIQFVPYVHCTQPDLCFFYPDTRLCKHDYPCPQACIIHEQHKQHTRCIGAYTTYVRVVRICITGMNVCIIHANKKNSQAKEIP